MSTTNRSAGPYDFDVLDEGWTQSPTGYVDRKVLIRFDGGTIGEVQIWEPQMLAAKSGGGP